MTRKLIPVSKIVSLQDFQCLKPWAAAEYVSMLTVSSSRMNLKSLYDDAISVLHVWKYQLPADQTGQTLWVQDPNPEGFTLNSRPHYLSRYLCTISSVQTYDVQFKLCFDLFQRGHTESQLRLNTLRAAAMERAASHCVDQLRIRAWGSSVEAQTAGGISFCPQQHCHHLVALIHAATAWNENVPLSAVPLTVAWTAASEAAHTRARPSKLLPPPPLSDSEKHHAPIRPMKKILFHSH